MPSLMSRHCAKPWAFSGLSVEPKIGKGGMHLSPTSVVVPSSRLKYIAEEENDDAFNEERTLTPLEILQSLQDQTLYSEAEKPPMLYIQGERKVRESSVFGGLMKSKRTLVSDHGVVSTASSVSSTEAASDQYNTRHQQNHSVLECVLPEVATHLQVGNNKSQTTVEYTSGEESPYSIDSTYPTAFSNKRGKGEYTEGDYADEIESMNDATGDVRTLHLYHSTNTKENGDQHSNTPSSSVVGDSTLISSSYDGKDESYTDTTALQKVRSALKALHHKKQSTQVLFQQASQGLRDNLSRANNLVQTLQEQLSNAYRQRDEALQRYEQAHNKRIQQVEADAVRTMHLEIVERSLSRPILRNMIAAPMTLSSGGGSSNYHEEENNPLSIVCTVSPLDKVMTLFATTNQHESTSTVEVNAESDYSTTESNSNNNEQWYHDFSVQELRLMKMRLQGILDLFETAQRRKESTNLRWQAQADAMMQDATSKYILYCQYGQI